MVDCICDFCGKEWEVTGATLVMEKKIVQRVFLNEGDEEPASQYCKDCFDEIAPYRIIPDESTAYGNDCPTGKCEM